MRELFEGMNERNTRIRYASPLLAIDETLYLYCGHIGLKQYHPDEPAINMTHFTEISTILKYLTPTLAYHMLVNQRNVKVQVQSITSPELTSIPNISSTSCLYTATFKGSMYPQIATSHRVFWQDRFQRKTSPLQAP